MNDPKEPPPSDREEAIFDAALELSGEQRAAYLKNACGNDDALRRRVEALLEAHERSTGILDEPAAARKTIVLEFPVEERAGDRIGHYKLLQQIGEGGCGVVYMAEQGEPVRRRVALKVIKLGMDTKQVIARFEAERQALAMMDHPNIAKVLDAGTTGNGRPFFVMELVRGIRITDYCDQNKLTTHERLQLFIQVCNAIQHAHQKGIIHRDIKPSNILVTLHDGLPVPKVIDFGIAKATQGRLTDQTLFTAFEQFIGTPAYMSPEQAEMSGLDVDTRSDIYALGVLLYELLTGRTPFDAKELLQSGIDELRRTIREKEPERPSTRLSTMLASDLTNVAQRRQAEPPKLIHLLRGDLDWIVMKSLEKDRTRRYETANALAMDITRSLKNEPVIARPPSNLYRFQKLVRRNKAAFAAMGTTAAALMIGLCVSLYSFVREKEARKRAEIAEAQLRYDNAELEKITKAGLLLSQGEYDLAEQHILGVSNHPSIAAIFNVLGFMHAKRGNWQPAVTNYAKVVESIPADHMAYYFLAPLLVESGDLAGYQRHRARILEQFGGMSQPLTAAHIVEECLLLPASSADLEIIRRLTGIAVSAEESDRDWDEIESVKSLAEYRQGNFAAAAEWAKKCLAEKRRPNRTVAGHMVLAMAQHRLGQTSDAETSLAKGLQTAETTMDRPGRLGDDWHSWIVARILMREAQALIGDPTPLIRTTPQPSQSSELEGLRARANENASRGRWQEAAAEFGKLQELQPNDGTWYERAVVLLQSGDTEAYRSQCEWILARFRDTTDASLARRVAKGCLLKPPRDARDILPASVASAILSESSEWQENVMCLVEYRAARFNEAVEWATKSLARTPVERRDAQTCMVLAMAHQRLNQPDQARAALARGRELIGRMAKPDSGELGPYWLDCIIANILMSEATGLIEGRGPMNR